LIKVALIGDLFVRPALLADALRTHLGPQVDQLVTTACELDYPLTPALHTAEIREFWGAEAQVLSVAAGADILLSHVPPISAAVLAQLPHLRAIGCTRTEPVNINVPAATARNIPIFYAPGRNAQAVAEFTLGLIIAERRNLARGHQALADGQWRGELYLWDTAPHELQGQTVGLIGFGQIGSRMPALLQPFGMRVIAYDPYVADEVFGARGATRVHDLGTLLAESDIVSLHARVTPETRGFIGEAQFRQMKRGAYFFNTARGPMVDYDALYNALVDGHLAGAGLETFAVEPPAPDWPLLRLPNVTLSPHMAGCSRESVLLAADMVCRDLALWYAGRPPEHCFNPEVLSS
jgi:D-3-phosphoglycerate dehydrogenase / 2-oxoglutarate reductase